MPGIYAGFLKMFGLTNTQDTSSAGKLIDPAISRGVTSNYSSVTLARLIDRSYTPQHNQAPMADSPVDYYSLINQLRPVHERIVRRRCDAERLKAIDPTIGQAENIIVSSIMSPNDLQDAAPMFSLEDTSLSEQQRQAVAQYLSSYYNDVYGLGDMLTEHTRSALFGAGAGVTVLLPEATLHDLIKTYDPAYAKNNLHSAGTEEFYGNECTREKVIRDVVTKERLSQIIDKKVFCDTEDAIKMPSSVLSGASRVPTIALEHSSKIKGSVDLDDIVRLAQQYDTAKIATEVMHSMYEQFPSDVFPGDDGILKLCAGFESVAVKFVTELKNGETIKICDNPEILRFGAILAKKQQRHLEERLQNMYNTSRPATTGSDTRSFLHAPVIDITEHMTTLADQKAYPFRMDYPPESIVPVCVPGSTKHLGYFALIDGCGHPIEANSYLIAGGNGTVSDRIGNAYAAMFGDTQTSSGIRTSLSGFSRTNTMDRLRAVGTNKVFNHVLDVMLKKHMSSVGFDDVSIGTFDTIAQCMLYRLYEKKNTALVFIPKKYVTYIAFAYHPDDGTGKSKLDDYSYTMALQSSFIVSTILAAIKNSTTKRKVRVSFNKNETNPMGVIENIVSQIINKERPSLSPTDPVQAYSSAVQQNISIETDGFPTAPGYNISAVEDTQRNFPKADDDLLERLDRYKSFALDVPPSAMSEVAEVQFSRSLATVHLFFAKKIERYSNTLCKFGSEHVRTHLSLSPTLIKGLVDVLNSTVPRVSGESYNGAETVNSRDLEIERQVSEIVAKLKIQLPKPTIAPDRAQYEILGDMIKLVDDYISDVYSDELIADVDSDVASYFKQVRAGIKADAIHSTAANLGYQGILAKIPEFGEYLLKNKSKMREFAQVVRAHMKAVEKDAAQVSVVEEQDKDW